MLDQVTSFRFQSIGATSQVSFCLDDISLLPSTLQTAGVYLCIFDCVPGTNSGPIKHCPVHGID